MESRNRGVCWLTGASLTLALGVFACSGEGSADSVLLTAEEQREESPFEGRTVRHRDEERLGLLSLRPEDAADGRKLLMRAAARATEVSDAKRFGLVRIDEDGGVAVEKFDTQELATRARATVREEDGALVEDGSEPLADDSEFFVEKDISGGVDNRFFLGSPAYAPATVGWHSGLSRIGTVSGATPDHHCTGTLIGRRVVFTAAHCVALSNNGTPTVQLYFTPQQQGTTGDWRHWGTATVVGQYIAAHWLTASCNNNPLAATCPEYDFAVLILEDDPFDTHPGWMGIAKGSNDWIKSLYLSNVGYPACGNAQSPANCQAHQPYGDWNNCGNLVTTFSASASTAWPWTSTSDRPRMQEGCDVSPGHSGGPVFYYNNSSPYVVANVYSGWPSPYGSQGVRFNTNLFNWLVTMKQTYN